ncbi:hypothetical protein J595_00881 [Acinetobacter sp. 1592897]|nr:hypothetical protein ACINWC487_2496 [Acinetobacter nosocomialis]EXB09925.1 hypothetical protein J514_3080 [Acinetobacter sp. 1396970]EXF01496.1 hypothetical protein J594_0388 [Acinetobacter sp. 259052]EXI11073.1 hypothetical protein J604_2642 [Acinetobacter sp. 694762]EXS42354.1 hypothetical protein J660_3431 [Acinetobacter sp. 88816]EYT19370.1 hypothetical protein J595_00881 [Acinetobacter sp. 1592897]KCX87628.1 hypothetical protein J568_3970 [Acinetobacter baumannii 6112]
MFYDKERYEQLLEHIEHLLELKEIKAIKLLIYKNTRQ